MKTLGRAGKAALIYQVGFGCGFLVGGILAVANYSKDHRMWLQSTEIGTTDVALGWGQFGSSQLKQKHLA